MVSIHDVSPVTRPRVGRMLADLGGAGVGAVSLLVVPDHHGRAPVGNDPAFGAWLREMQSLGHEAVLHGFRHLRPPSRSDGPVARAITSIYTAGEGEFFDLDEGEAAARLEMGRRALAACGVTPRGFIAPAWLLGGAARRAVARAGFLYTTTIGRVEPLDPGARPHTSRSLVWSTRGPWRRAASLAWNPALAAALARNPLLRIGLHPPDWDHPKIRAQALALVRAALAGREAITYDRWVSRP